MALWYYTPGPACLLAGALLLGCGGNDCGEGGGGTSTTCPPAASAFGKVIGSALRSDGSPVVHKRAFVACGDAVGLSEDGTDEAGNFEVHLAYAVSDTILSPYPPRAVDGSFELRCLAHLEITSQIQLVQDPVFVRFAPSEAQVTATLVELREPAP